MEPVLLVVVAVVITVAMAGFSRKLGIAAPLLLVVVGAALSYVPGMPEIDLEPEWIFVVVLPPLLYAAAVNVPLMDFHRNVVPITGLGVGAVILSAFATGALLYELLPDLDFAAAVALGAVISPTDAVAATSIAKRLGLPHRLVTVLEGESLINDASALVLMRTAIAAVGGTVSIGGVAGQFAWAVLGAAAIGLAIGLISVSIRARFQDEVLATTTSFVVPFLAYVPAEYVGASGVIGVVTAGLVIGHESARRFTAQARLTERLNWRTVQFVLENGVFLLMGYQVKHLVDDVVQDGYGIWETLGIGVLMVVVLIAARGLFVVPLIGYLRRSERRTINRQQAREARAEQADDRLSRRRAADAEFLRREGLGWRGGAVIAWSGMRGVVTVAAAQSLPNSVPYRSELILIALTVAVATLAIGGLSLPAVIRRLRLPTPAPEHRSAELRELMAEITSVAEESLRNPDLRRDDGRPFDAEVVERVGKETAALRATVEQRLSSGEDGRPVQLQQLRLRILDAQRAALLDARSAGTYSSQTVHEAELVLDGLELRAGVRGWPSRGH